MQKPPLVSVALITYNQENYIRETLDGIVMQKTDFEMEVIIGEDCSTDNTRSICEEYIQKYPDRFKPLFHDKNLGMIGNWIATIQACSGKYIALCEGDDYWTDPYKLQKQVDFMEENPEYSLCAHNADILEYGHLKQSQPVEKQTLTTTDIILQDWGIMTASIMFRKEAFDIPGWYGNVKNADYGLQLLVSLNGKVNILPDTMSVYRKHAEGISSTLRPLSQAAWITYLLYEFNRYTKGKYRKVIIDKIKRVYKNQIGFAKEYHLRKAVLTLKFYRYLVPLDPFLIRSLRK